MKDKLKKALKPKRYQHSLGVAKTARILAQKYGANVEKAYIAGLLHDCAKLPEIKDQLKLAKKYGMEFDDVTMACPAVIHAPLGARHAKEEYGINDKEILDAIEYHTVGRADMTLMDKIIYVADMIEPTRDFDGVEKLRKTAEKSLDKTLKACLKQSIVHNVKKGSVVHPNTLDAWNYIMIHK